MVVPKALHCQCLKFWLTACDSSVHNLEVSFWQKWPGFIILILSLFLFSYGKFRYYRYLFSLLFYWKQDCKSHIFFHSKNREEKLKKDHREEMTSQLQANKLTIDAVKSQAEQKLLNDIEELTVQHENDQGLKKMHSLRDL